MDGKRLMSKSIFRPVLKINHCANLRSQVSIGGPLWK
jgi:hypothetical protein